MKNKRRTTTIHRPGHGGLLAACCALAGVFAGAGARAAGHFDVDDAATLDPGRCQYEMWWGRTGVEPATGLHAGPACRVGPVELGLNLDRLSVGGLHSVSGGPQLKWTFLGTAGDAPFSAAVSMGTVFDLKRGGRMGGQLMLPVTWRPAPGLQLHAYLGADWTSGTGQRTPRGGAALEWALNDTVSVIAERNRAADAWVSRMGGRFSLTPQVSVDVSASRTRLAGGRATTGFVVGLNHEFGWK